MPRTRKQTSNVVVGVSSPQVLITRDEYFQDIKVRWEIHQYEIKKLVEDVRNFTSFVTPYVKNALDYSVGFYQQIRAKYASQ